MNVNLASKLRQSTGKAHTMAENSAFMKCFQKGVIKQETFRKFSACLYFIYSALEAEVKRHKDDDVIGLIHFPEIERKQNLEEDLKFYYGENWREEIKIIPECQEFVDRIHEVANNDLPLLVAHSYVRYMGDLSGGQALKNLARSFMGLPEDKGTRFYEFDALNSIEAIKEFKTKYRNALDSLPVDEVTAQRIADEAIRVFTLNMNTMHGLEDEVKASVDEQTFAQIVSVVMPGSTESHPHQQMVSSK
ncbi:MAG: biliverdin-producing heme oxygenase [Prochloraceae cyanobacterium]|nr:biliverdin-producing heme oxygenase [Prochloraceae cyanobacterium]